MIDRFYFPDAFEKNIQLTGSEFHHLSVMRIRVGEEIELIDGQGHLAKALLESIDKKTAKLHLMVVEKHPKPAPQIVLGLPLIKIDRLEWAIEKGCELGADAFYLFAADYSEKKQLSEHQLDRLEQICISSMKQCGRLYLPKIHWCASIEKVCDEKWTIIFGDTRSSAPWIARVRSPSLFISGPEKGFSLKELEFLQNIGRGARLHQNILRAETAPLVALSLLSRI